jgi:hypothetical protein
MPKNKVNNNDKENFIHFIFHCIKYSSLELIKKKYFNLNTLNLIKNTNNF